MMTRGSKRRSELSAASNGLRRNNVQHPRVHPSGGTTMNRGILFAALAVLPTTVFSQADPRPEILVLGTYHMANPGRDVHNMQADDVLSPKRQREIARLIEVLKAFHPTKIAIESDVSSERLTREYAGY